MIPMAQKNHPTYLQAYADGMLDKLIERVTGLLESCVICPRKCRVNRLAGQLGYCQIGRNSRVYSFSAHHGEEPPVSGTRGSGTIFFSGCNMKCAYCQNYRFSQSREGRELSPEGLADIMLKLQAEGCHNINLVTPTHVMPQILEALRIAIPQGFGLILVYNTSGYELAQSIALLEGIVDVYLADMRYADSATAEKYSQALEYPCYNRESVSEMQRQAGVACFDEDGIIASGLLLRHLVLPHGLSGTAGIMKFIAEKISPDSYISLMSQYLPCHKAGAYKELSRRISLKEYAAAEKIMRSFGLHNGWTQEARGLERLAGVHIKIKPDQQC
jgi:putative pyruvate formate lyase activating enzyme